MRTYIIIALIAIVLAFIYAKRKSLNSYFNKQVEDIQNLNATHPNIEIIKEKFSALDTKALTQIIENSKLTDNELKAIQKIFQERQVTPNQYD